MQHAKGSRQEVHRVRFRGKYRLVLQDRQFRGFWSAFQPEKRAKTFFGKVPMGTGSLHERDRCRRARPEMSI